MRRRQSGEEISCDPLAGERAQALSSADLTGAVGAAEAARLRDILHGIAANSEFTSGEIPDRLPRSQEPSETG